MARWEMPWVAASRLNSASQALKSPPHGAARDGPQIAMKTSASAIGGNQVRMDCMIGPAMSLGPAKLPGTFGFRTLFIWYETWFS
jgi:hypothetical protein